MHDFIINYKSQQTCIPLNMLLTCDNKLVLSNEPSLFNRNDECYITSFVISLQLPFYLGCNKLNLRNIVDEVVNITFRDIDSNGEYTGIMRSADFCVNTIVQNEFNYVLELKATNVFVFIGDDGCPFTGCKYSITLNDTLELTEQQAICNKNFACTILQNNSFRSCIGPETTQCFDTIECENLLANTGVSISC